MLKFAREIPRIGEAEHLFKAHFEEVGTFKEIGMDINWDAIWYAHEHGILRYFTARKEDGAIIGYDAFIVSPDIFHKHKMAATEIAVYIHPVERGCGIMFAKWVDSVIDADIIYRGTKGRHGKALERLGYVKTNEVYGRLKSR